MKRSHGHAPDIWVWMSIAILLVFGLVMLSSASSVLGFQRFDDSNFFLKRQLIWTAVGVLALFVTYRIDYHTWKSWSVPIMIALIALLLAVFVPGLGIESLGAHRWINLGFFGLQPSELAKLATIIYLAAWLDQREHQMQSARATLLPFLIALGLVSGIILAEPDLGTTTVVLMVSLILYFASGAPWKFVLGVIGAGIGFFLLMIQIAPYRAQRFTVFLNPELDPLGIGYHINQALLAIGSGGWFGLGLGHSRQKFNYLPEPAGDSIFAVTAEELGFLFATLFVVAWSFLIYRGFQIAKHAPDRFGRLMATGIVAWLGIQAFLNIGALTGLLPLTGIPLPFLSYGGSAIIVNLAAVGILLNISRQTVYGSRRA